MRTVNLKIGTLLVAAFMFLSCDDLFNPQLGGSGTTSLTSAQIVEGLRGALEVGIDTAATDLSQRGGYLLNEIITIALPEDVTRALSFATSFKRSIDNASPLILLALGAVFDFSVFDGLGDSLRVSINRAAEQAAPRSVAVFKDAIVSMTIADGLSILQGDSIAATTYLHGRTFTGLTGVYSPFVDSTLALVGAQNYWETLATSYNAMAAFYDIAKTVMSSLPALPFDTLPGDLAGYTTARALDGLFWAVGEEESKIRRDPLARVTQILQDVFGWLDEKNS